jgi:8-oxo-dGTP pyrophosphatase MutT (NUDIX family)
MTNQTLKEGNSALATFDAVHDGAVRPDRTKALKPRHAATLIVVRRDAGKPQVLMGRRNPTHVFMPGKWVFPGGRVDRGDFLAPSATELSAEVTKALQHHPRHPNPARLPRALALAAVRDLFEEAGLLLAKPAAPRPGTGGWREFLAQGALPDLSAMQFVARAITPPLRPRRFDARFFMADATWMKSPGWISRRPWPWTCPM